MLMDKINFCLKVTKTVLEVGNRVGNEFIIMKKGLRKTPKPLILTGSPARTRTADPVANSHLLCLLSYWGTYLPYKLTLKVISKL